METRKLSKEERETHYCIDEVDNCWIADSTIPKDIRMLERKGWEKIDEQLYADGTIMAATFKAPRNYLTVRKYDTNRPKRVISDEQKLKMRAGLKRHQKSL